MSKSRPRAQEDAFSVVVESADSEGETPATLDIWYASLAIVMFIIYQVTPRPILYNHLADAAKEFINIWR